jgi:hypothetical protein
VAEDVRGIGEAMEHEKAMAQMRYHLARAGREIQAAQRLLDVPEQGRTKIVLARALAYASASVNDAMDTIQRTLDERGGS